MWKMVAWLFILLSVIVQSKGLQCFIDTQGTSRAKDGEVLDTTKFKVFNCSMVSRIQKVSLVSTLEFFM